MRALILHEPGGPLVLEDVPRPVAGPGEAIVRVRACGLGLTLVWNRDGRREPGRLPRIIGHEIAGEIAELGPVDDAVDDGRGRSPLAIGDRVAAYYYLFCGVCRWCLDGQQNRCLALRGHVGREIDGGLAEYFELPVRNLVRLPDAVSDVDGAVAADAVATSVHVLARRAAVQPGEAVLIVGAGGGVGSQMIQVAKAFGARVLAVDLGPEKLAFARDGGADVAIDGGDGPFDTAVLAATGGLGADVVVELVGRSETLASSALSLAHGGRLVLVGSSDRKAILPVDHGTLRGEAAILGTQYATRADVAEALELLASGRIRAMVGRTCGLEEVDDTLRAVERGEVSGRACLVLARTG